MTLTAQRSSRSGPGRLECHPAHVVCARSCAVHELDSEDSSQTIADVAVSDEAGSSIVEADAFRLHVQFVHAHGIPKGEFTTFCNVGPPGADVAHAPKPGWTRRKLST